MYTRKRSITGKTAVGKDTLWNIFSIVIFIVIFIGFGIFFYTRQKRTKATGEQYDFTVNDTELRITTPTSDTHYAWSRFPRALEDQHLFLLVIEEDNVIAFPKRAIAGEEDILRLRTLIEQRIGLIQSQGKKSAPTPPSQ